MSTKKNETYGLPVVKVRLVQEEPLNRERRITSPDDALAIISEELKDYDREAFCVLNLKTTNAVINMNIVSVGTLNASLAEPREVFKSCILSNAKGVILVHNHPSGDPIPSAADYETTRQLVTCGKILGIPVMDHIIISGQGLKDHYSMLEHGDLPQPAVLRFRKPSVKER